MVNSLGRGKSFLECPTCWPAPVPEAGGRAATAVARARTAATENCIVMVVLVLNEGRLGEVCKREKLVLEKTEL